MLKFSTLILFLGFLIGCDTGPESPRGFSLPLGDAARGEATFIELNCLACHSLTGFDHSKLTIEKELEVSIVLGGKVSRVRTYAELVTSIINPSHRFSRYYSEELIQDEGISKMRNYNDEMTVSQLIDLVTFLQPHYELLPYENTYYRPHPYMPY